MGERTGSLEVVVILKPSFWAGRRVLLTGHTGFKGSWLSLWLLQLGAQVWGYALPPENEISLFNALKLADKFTHLHHRLGDLSDLRSLKSVIEDAQPTIIFHLAAQPLVRRSYIDPLGTWATNVQGSLHLLEALKGLNHPCAVVMVTTDKVYANREWDFGYREDDRLGGLDPYSASKAAVELAVSSWRSSFCGSGHHQTPYLKISTARAGNVIGGGDWAAERIVPDVIRSLIAGKPIPVRNQFATRPWQHVLEPLGAYLLLAERLTAPGRAGSRCATAFNFGPQLESNRSVGELVEEALQHWPGDWLDLSDPMAPHEAGKLHLQIDKAHHQLNWRPNWNFSTTVARTVAWYRAVHEGSSPLDCCLADLDAYHQESVHVR